jgi:hypothetical protein
MKVYIINDFNMQKQVMSLHSIPNESLSTPKRNRNQNAKISNVELNIDKQLKKNDN